MLKKYLLAPILAPQSLFAKILTKNQNNAQFVTKRSLVHYTALKLTHASVAHKKFSLLNGAIFSFIGGLERFYKVSKLSQTPTFNQKLVHLLFYQQGEELRVTHNKSLAAYSLTPELVGKLLKLLDDNTLEQSSTRVDFLTQWRRSHFAKTGAHLTDKKVYGFLDTLIQAKKECENEQYPPHLTETLILSFLFYKIEKQVEVSHYGQALQGGRPHDHMIGLENQNTINLEDLASLKKYIQAYTYQCSQSVHQYEEILLALLMLEKPLQPVLMSAYGYCGKKPKANCIEVAFHNLCNIFLYDVHKGKFDFNRLPKTLSPHPELIAFYQAQSFSPYNINTHEVGQAFMNLVSNVPDCLYGSGDYELYSDKQNFLPIMNYLWGTHAKSFEELSILFSQPQRQIHFECVMDTEIRIDITEEMNKESFLFKLGLMHGALVADRFKTLETRKSTIAISLKEIQDFLHQTHPYDWALFSLLEKLSGVSMPLERRSEKRQQRQVMNDYFQFHFPKTMGQALILFDVLIQAGKEEHYHAELVYLVNQFNFLLEIIIARSLYSVLEILKRYQVDLNQKNCSGTPILHFASTSQMLTFLVEAGVDINATNSRGETLLHLVHDLDLFKKLLELGADPNILSFNQLSPMHQAKSLDHAKCLLAHGGLVSLTNSQGQTPLHFTKDISIARLWIMEGAEVNARDITGTTALHSVKSLEMAQLLLEAGANPNLTDYDGLTVLDMVTNNEIHDLISSRYTSLSLM